MKSINLNEIGKIHARVFNYSRLPETEVYMLIKRQIYDNYFIMNHEIYNQIEGYSIADNSEIPW